jgi:hypothetical protein
MLCVYLSIFETSRNTPRIITVQLFVRQIPGSSCRLHAVFAILDALKIVSGKLWAAWSGVCDGEIDLCQQFPTTPPPTKSKK